MKHIINGKRYDTQAPLTKEIASWSNGFGVSDFRGCTETLYRTGRGAFFLYGKGGPMTRWSRSYGTMHTDGSGIMPLSRQEAQAWCETHHQNEALETYFPEYIEDA